MARLRMGMVGGGAGSFIGPVHRIAAEMDREIELVAGAFSADPERSRAAGASYGIDATRAYSSLDALIAGEAARSDRIDFVTIATPNYHHLPAARAALQAGFAVMSDKPATATLEEAHLLAGIVAHSRVPYRLSYTYTGYPLVREARARIAAGALGDIRKVVMEYSQGWLSDAAQGKQAEWRVDPAQAGTGGCIADIGVHAFHLAEFTTGLRVTQLLADLGTVVPGRVLDDDATVLLRFDNGARGVLMASQIAWGELNGLRLRVYGTKGGLDWRQEQPNTLLLNTAEGGLHVLRTGDATLGPDARAATRTPGGHPEGYLEAFANLYRDFAALLRGEPAPLLPDMHEGLRSMAFVAKAVGTAGWTELSL